MSMEGAKKTRDKIAKTAKGKRENVGEAQSTASEDDMATVAKQPSSATDLNSPTVVEKRLTFKVDQECLEPKEKHQKRLSRNETEKYRRDRLNAYFLELAKLVPLVMESNKKIDKASILRLTVAYLRIYNDLVKGSKKSPAKYVWRPDLAMYENLGNLLLESFGGFLLVISKTGVLIFATEAITKYLGHSLSDVLGAKVKNIIHPDDVIVLMRQFEMTERDSLIKDTDDETDPAHVPVNGQRSFCIRMRNVLDPQSTCYELVHLVGHLKKMPPLNRDSLAASFSDSQLPPDPPICLVAVTKLISHQPIQELYPHENNIPNQWITRHELNGKITYSDQRGALLTGFLPGESIGFSPYSLLHLEDIAAVIDIHRLFLTDGAVPQTVFRMYTKSREILFIQTNTHMVVDMWTSKPKFIISINTVLAEEDGLLALEDQRQRIELAKSAMDCASSPSENDDDGSRKNRCSLVEQQMADAELPPSPDCIVIPKVKEVGDTAIDISVGQHKFRISLSEIGKFDPKSPRHDASGISSVFSAYATEDDSGKNISMVTPSFQQSGSTVLGNQDLETRTCRGRSISENSCSSLSIDGDASGKPDDQEGDSVGRRLDRERSGGTSFPGHVTQGQSAAARDCQGSLSELPRRIVGASGSLKDAVSGKPSQENLLLRRLLMEKPQGGMRIAEGTAGSGGSSGKGEDQRSTTDVAPSVGGKGMLDATMSDKYCRIKSLLRESHELPRSSIATQNGQHPGTVLLNRRQRNGCHPPWNGIIDQVDAALLTSSGHVITSCDIVVKDNEARSSEENYRICQNFGYRNGEASHPDFDSSHPGDYSQPVCASTVNGTTHGTRDQSCVNGFSSGSNGFCHGSDGHEDFLRSFNGDATKVQSHLLIDFAQDSVSRSRKSISEGVRSPLLNGHVGSCNSYVDKYQYMKRLLRDGGEVQSINEPSLEPTEILSQLTCVSLSNLTNGQHVIASGNPSNFTNGQHVTASGNPSNFTNGQHVTASGNPSNFTNGQYPVVAMGNPNNFTNGQHAVASGNPNNFVNGQHAVASGNPKDFINGQYPVTLGIPSHVTNGQHSVVLGNPNCPQSETMDSTTTTTTTPLLNGWHQDTSIGDSCTLSEFDDWVLDYVDFDDTLFLGQQNKMSGCLMDDL